MPLTDATTAGHFHAVQCYNTALIENCLRASGQDEDALKPIGTSSHLTQEKRWRIHGRWLCGYSMGNFYKGAAIEEIKGQHSHLVADSGDAAAIH
jgi:hypothetical protein